MRDPLRVVAVLGAAVVLVALAVVLTRSSSRLAYENGKQVETPAVLSAGGSMCQAGEYVPPGAAFVRVWLSTARKPGPPAEVSVTAGDRVLARGHVAPGYVDRAVDVRLPPLRTEARDSTVCIRDDGPGRIGVMGSPPGPTEQPARAGRVAQPQVVRPGESAARGAGVGGPPTVVRLEWHRPGSESWLAYAPVLAQRAGQVKATFIGSWAMWVALAFTVTGGAGGVLLVLRRGAPQ